MADENKNADAQKKQYKAKITEEIEAGVFANAVSVHFNADGCVLDMAYTLPNAPEPTVKIVSRINMSHRTAESMLKVLSNAFLDYQNKAKQAQGQAPAQPQAQPPEQPPKENE